MSEAEILILAVTVQGLSDREVSRVHGVSKSRVHQLHQRWLVEGDAAFQPRSRAPRRVANRTSDPIRNRVLELQTQLTALGDDAGADTIRSLLAAEGTERSRSTIWRILKAADAIVAQPQI